MNYFKERDSLIYLFFGEGYSSFTHNYAEYVYKGNSDISMVEVDPLDLFGIYGLTGLFLYIPLLLGVFHSLKSYCKRKDLFYFYPLGALILILGHSFIAGHVLLETETLQFTSIIVALGYLKR